MKMKKILYKIARKIFVFLKRATDYLESEEMEKEYCYFGKESKIHTPNNIHQKSQIYIGENVVVHAYSRMQIINQAEYKPKIKIGDNTGLGNNLTILAGADVVIGKDVAFAGHVFISSGNHGISVENGIPYGEQLYTGRKVEIGDGCWIGEKSCILSGVNIGKGSIIGAGSVVTKDVPEYSIAVGNPCRVIKKYDFSKGEWINV